MSTGARDRLSRRALWLAAAPAGAVALALALGALLLLATGSNPFRIYGSMLRGVAGTGYGLGQTLFKATPLIFTGLAVAFGFRAGLFNIGVEGQLYLGAFVMALVGTHAAALPALWLLPLTLLAGGVTGAAWAALPGFLKARFGAHEVINTIMLNFVAFALVSWVGRRFFVPATVHTPPIGANAVLPRLEALIPSLHGAQASLALIIAVAAALGVGVLLFRTRLGFELRAVGLNPPAAECGGIAPGSAQIKAMAISGAIAGVAGCAFVQGYKHFFELGFSAGVGFLGIAVALLGRNHPLGVVLAALFFGALDYGGLAVGGQVPRELVQVLQAIVILLAICIQQVVERTVRRMPA